jgi:topoisomerase-4 subunit A
MAKARQKAYKKGAAIRLPISKHIDVNFRDYALYVLNNRGIPSFYDGLTNVQKFILQNSPQQYGKTVSVVGSCISAGYHHGDKSLAGAINKLARPFSCANQMLEGDGFFGTPINQEAAAARYTSVRISKNVAGIIKENSFLNTRDEDGQWDPLWLRVPIGLSTTIVGIAVGYKTTVLPRSIEDMEKYLAGDIKEVKPSFIGFKGTVNRFQNLDRSWLIEGTATIDSKNKTVHITSLPPMMKYKKFLGKIENLMEKYPGKVSMRNDSSDDIDLNVTFRGRSREEFNDFAKSVQNFVKMIVTETPVFVKDGTVLVYDKVEDYLDDFQYRISELKLKRTEYFHKVTSDELDFQRAKKLYLEFMLAEKRNDKAIEVFLGTFSKKISTRLDAIRLRFLSEEEIKRTVAEIKKLERELKKLERELNKLSKSFAKLIDPTIARGTTNRNSGSVDLFDDTDFDDFDGIEIYTGKESEVEDEEEIEA